jgi:hypothetical protein
MPQLTELQELEQAYCEFHKDVYGVKARWYRAESVEQARADLDRLQAAGELVWAEEKRAQEQAAQRFEKRIEDTITSGAGDRQTALRWIHQAEDTNGDDEFLCYSLGLPFNYIKRDAVAA